MLRQKKNVDNFEPVKYVLLQGQRLALFKVLIVIPSVAAQCQQNPHTLRKLCANHIVTVSYTHLTLPTILLV
eukprot:4256298-Amphidinium_carterae.1